MGAFYSDLMKQELQPSHLDRVEGDMEAKSLRMGTHFQVGAGLNTKILFLIKF